MLNVFLAKIISGLRSTTRRFRLALYLLRKRNARTLGFVTTHFTLGRFILLALALVAVFYYFDIGISHATLSFLQQDLFFTPLNMVIPFLLATAMFAVPQRIPIETLATIGVSVITTYLVTTMFSSSLGYGSVKLFNTSQYLAPLLSADLKGESKEFETDFTLLYIIFSSLLLSIFIAYLLRKRRALSKKIAYLSLLAEKLSYSVLNLILWLMPFAVFASILGSLRAHGIDKMSSLGWFVLYVNLPQFLYLLVIMLVIKMATGVSFRFVGSAIKNLANIAIPSGSSAATILTNVKTARTFPILPKYKNKGFIASLLPFGATVNMDGTALYITIMCKIAADIQGLDIGYWDIIPYVILYSCAAAAVPSASIILITAIYTLIGIEAHLTLQILGLMIAVDWINDRVRTQINVSGDLLAILLALNDRSPLQLLVTLFRKSERGM